MRFASLPWAGVAVRPLASTFGVEVAGIDLTAALTDRQRCAVGHGIGQPGPSGRTAAQYRPFVSTAVREVAVAPEHRPSPAMTRRGFLSAASGAALSLTAAGVLGGCTDATSSPAGGSADSGPGGIPLGRPDRPVTLPLYDDSPAIAAGLAPEAGPLQVYTWVDYVSPKVIAEFRRRYGASVQVTTFNSVDEAIAKLTSGAVHFDVATPGVADLPRLVAGKLIRPLNLEYIPNLKANVWPPMADPWYDRGPRYTVPYGMSSTGISWRADKLPDFDPTTLANPYDAFWQATAAKGRVRMLDDQRHALSWALLRNGVKDINTGDQSLLDRAAADLVDLVRRVNLKFANNDFETMPSGAVWLHESWSGALVLAQRYLPKGTPVDVLRYWWPGNAKGVPGGIVQNDLLVVLRGGRNPVLAHLFLNHLLDSATALQSFAFTGFQQPLRGSEPEALVRAGLVPPNLKGTGLTQEQVAAGLVNAPLSERATVLWQNAWAKVKAAT
jgi:spermidine/putrescine transport system substrate-binding protein